MTNALLILDEATSGLDPVVRDDILDMLLDFVQDEEHSILVSSHITSDLEKIADYIVFIHEGKVVFEKPKDELTERYGIIKCGAAQFDALDKSDIISYRKMDYEWQILVSDREKMQKKYPKAPVVPAAIDEIMLLYIKGKRDERCFGERSLYCQKQYPRNHRQSGCFGLWLILFAGNQRTSGFGPGCRHNSSLYQYYQ